MTVATAFGEMEASQDEAVALRSELRLARSSASLGPSLEVVAEFRSLKPQALCVQLESERLRSTRYAEELRQAKEQSIALHKQVELEQECITLKLMKRLEQLKREKQNLANEVNVVGKVSLTTLYPASCSQTTLAGGEGGGISDQLTSETPCEGCAVSPAVQSCNKLLPSQHPNS